jgi:hypothetical protein
MKFEILVNQDLSVQMAALSGILFFPVCGKTGVKVLYHG